MVRYLSKYFIKQCELSKEQIKQEISNAPNLKIIISWLELVLDTHVTEIILVKEFHQLISNLKNFTQLQLQLCEQLEGVSSYLKFLRKNLGNVDSSIKTLPTLDQAAYEIEVFQF